MLNHIIANDKYSITYIRNDTNIYFKAKDAAQMLGYSNTAKSIYLHVDNEFKFKITDIYPKGGHPRGSTGPYHV